MGKTDTIHSFFISLGAKSIFQYNVADFGGAISVSLKANLNIQQGVVIRENRANYDGGGIHVEGKLNP